MADDIIASHRDLSFTATSDAPGTRSNWSVPHDRNGYWGDAVPVGRRYFREVAELANVDEQAAYLAIVAAINAPEWNRADGGCGWGIEHGFSERLAAAALIGLRAMRDGAEPFRFEPERETIMSNAAPTSTEGRAAANKQEA